MATDQYSLDSEDRKRQGNLLLKDTLFSDRRPKGEVKTALLFQALAFGILASLLSSCATAPVASNSNMISTQDLEIDSALEVLLLPPLLKFERMQDEAILDASDYNGDRIEIDLMNEAKDALDVRKFVSRECLHLEESEAKNQCEQLQLLSDGLASGFINKEGETLMNGLASFSENYAVLAHHLKVKVGPGGYWDPNTGAIGSSMNSSLFNEYPLLRVFSKSANNSAFSIRVFLVILSRGCRLRISSSKL